MRRLTGRRALALWLVVCGTLCLGLGAAVGGPVNPYIEVHETAEWQALLDAGAAGGGGGGGGALIRPVSAQSFFDLVMQDPEQWPVEYRPVGVFGGETLFSTPELSAPVNGHEDGRKKKHEAPLRIGKDLSRHEPYEGVEQERYKAQNTQPSQPPVGCNAFVRRRRR